MAPIERRSGRTASEAKWTWHLLLHTTPCDFDLKRGSRSCGRITWSQNDQSRLSCWQESARCGVHCATTTAWSWTTSLSLSTCCFESATGPEQDEQGADKKGGGTCDRGQSYLMGVCGKRCTSQSGNGILIKASFSRLSRSMRCTGSFKGPALTSSAFRSPSAVERGEYMVEFEGTTSGCAGRNTIWLGILCAASCRG